jgi:AAA-like domain
MNHSPFGQNPQRRQTCTLKASEQGLTKLKKARLDRGLAIDNSQWLYEASLIINSDPGVIDLYKEGFYANGISVATWKRFLGVGNWKPIRPKAFKAYCQILGFDNWKELVEQIISTDEEERCLEIITQLGSFLRIKSPEKMGKSLLKDRVLERIDQQEKYHIVDFDFQLLNFSEIKDIKQFLQLFCRTISYELGLIDQVDDIWNDHFGSNYNTTNYVKKSILEKLDRPLVLVLDHIDLVFENHRFAEDFCNMLRGWESKNTQTWQKLRLVIVQSTAVYAELDINFSPLENIGVTITLNEFNDDQIQNLLREYNLSLTQEKIADLINLVGRNPYLLNQAFNAMAYQSRSFENILSQANTASSIYYSHLQEYLEIINRKPELKEALTEVITANQPVKIETFAGFKLQSLRLINLEGDYATPSCRLYHEYFKKQLT